MDVQRGDQDTLEAWLPLRAAAPWHGPSVAVARQRAQRDTMQTRKDHGGWLVAWAGVTGVDQRCDVNAQPLAYPQATC